MPVVAPRVFNVRRPHPDNAVLVDRSTDFGNPFVIGRDGNRDDVCDKYDHWIWMPEQVGLRQRMMEELRGKDLLCWCEPERCHARTVLQIANAQ